MAQIITPQKAKLGPDNNTTAIYIYIYISLSLSPTLWKGTQNADKREQTQTNASNCKIKELHHPFCAPHFGAAQDEQNCWHRLVALGQKALSKCWGCGRGSACLCACSNLLSHLGAHVCGAFGTGIKCTSLSLSVCTTPAVCSGYLQGCVVGLHSDGLERKSAYLCSLPSVSLVLAA